MDTEDLQQAAVEKKQERVRARKLRNSCDACSNSKTKCDQRRPECLRCEKSGIHCNYSISQRKGKPPASSRDPSQLMSRHKNSVDNQSSKQSYERMGSSDIDAPHDAVESQNFHLDQASSATDMLLPMDEDVIPSFWPPFMPDMSDYTTSGFSTTSSNIFDQEFNSVNSSPMSQSSPNKASEDIFNFPDGFPGLLDIETHQEPSRAETTFPITPLPTPSASGHHSPSPRYECSGLAFSTLESLNLNSQGCSHATHNPTNQSQVASLDQILIANKSAVENVHRLLCCPCSLSQQSNLMLSLIIDKILSLYQSIIRTGSCTSSTSLSSRHNAGQGSCHPMSPSSSDNHSTHSEYSSSAHQERLTIPHTPITIGAYKMDAKDEQRMRMQLVYNELRKAAALVEQYADRYHSNNGSIGSSNGGGGGLGLDRSGNSSANHHHSRHHHHQDSSIGGSREDKGVNTVLIGLLRRRLREAAADIVHELRNI